jgi:hypothetical protein
MKTKFVLVSLLCMAVGLQGCKDLLGGKEEEKKTESELRAERNKPIYEQFIGEWDEYDDENLTIKRDPIKISSTEFTLSGRKNFVTTVDYSDIIYTLEEFKAVVDYDGGVGSSDLSKDGFIKLEWYYDDYFEFFKYHFYDKDKFSLKLVTVRLLKEEIEQVSTDGGISYYKRVGSGGSSGSGESVDLPGGYELTVGGYTCTLTFNSNGAYVFDHPVGTDRNGSWTQSGGELTMNYTVAGNDISEVFITTEEGNVVTLTLKDDSADVSQILASFNLAATSVSLTRK